MDRLDDVLTTLLDGTPEWLLRAGHDLGLAAWFGGSWMGAVALNGASREVEDPTQRTRVVNAGWFRWAAIVPVAVGMHLAGGVGLSRQHRRAGSGTQEGMALARAVVLGVAVAATIESGRQGRVVTAAGDVPTATAVVPIAETPPEVARAQRILRVVQWVIPAATATLIAVDAWQQAHGGTRLAPNGWLRR